MKPTAAALIEHFRLEPLPVEGGLFRQTWKSPDLVQHPNTARSGPFGTAIIAMLHADPDCFSAMHRLPTAEIWHFYLGDPLEMLLLHPDGSVQQLVLGQDVLAGQLIQVVVPANTWMGARIQPGGDYALFGCTMAPGFSESDYEGADQSLAEAYPTAAARILSLIRPGNPYTME
jgi:uncharacterized protein